MMEVYREAVRIAQLDHPFGDWAASVAATPPRPAASPTEAVSPSAPRPTWYCFVRDP